MPARCGCPISRYRNSCAITAISSSRSAISRATSAPEPRLWASIFIRASPPSKLFMERQARSSASPPATWAWQGRQSQSRGLPAAWSCAAKYTLFAEGARGSLAKELIARYGLDEGSRAAKIRHRPQGTLAGRSGKARAGLVQHTLGWPLDSTPAAARSSIISRTVSSPSASSSTSTIKIRICRRSRSFSASRRIRWSRDTFEGGQADLLWRARDHRGRLAIGAEARFSRRRADRLRGGLRERAAHQGQP